MFGIRKRLLVASLVVLLILGVIGWLGWDEPWFAVGVVVGVCGTLLGIRLESGKWP